MQRPLFTAAIILMISKLRASSAAENTYTYHGGLDIGTASLPFGGQYLCRSENQLAPAFLQVSCSKAGVFHAPLLIECGGGAYYTHRMGWDALYGGVFCTIDSLGLLPNAWRGRGGPSGCWISGQMGLQTDICDLDIGYYWSINAASCSRTVVHVTVPLSPSLFLQLNPSWHSGKAKRLLPGWGSHYGLRYAPAGTCWAVELRVGQAANAWFPLWPKLVISGLGTRPRSGRLKPIPRALDQLLIGQHHTVTQPSPITQRARQPAQQPTQMAHHDRGLTACPFFQKHLAFMTTIHREAESLPVAEPHASHSPPPFLECHRAEIEKLKKTPPFPDAMAEAAFVKDCIVAQLSSRLRLDCAQLLHAKNGTTEFTEPFGPNVIHQTYAFYLAHLKNLKVAPNNPSALEASDHRQFQISLSTERPEFDVAFECSRTDPLDIQNPNGKNAGYAGLFCTLRYRAQLHAYLAYDCERARRRRQDTHQQKQVDRVYQAQIDQLRGVRYGSMDHLKAEIKAILEAVRAQLPKTAEQEFTEDHLAFMQQLKASDNRSSQHKELHSFVAKEIQTWEAKLKSWPFDFPKETLYIDCLGAQLHGYLLLDRQTCLDAHPHVPSERIHAIYQAYLEKLKKGVRVQSTRADVSTLTPYTDPVDQSLEAVYVNGLSVEWDERHPGQPRHVACDLGSEHPAYLFESSMMIDETHPAAVAILRASPLRYQAYLHCLLEIDRQHASLVLEDSDQERALNAIYEAAIQKLPCQAVYTWPKDLPQKAQQARLNVRKQAFPANLEKENKAFAQQHRALLEDLQVMASRSPTHSALQVFLNAQIQQAKTWEPKLESWPFYMPQSTWHVDCLGAQLHGCLLLDRQTFLEDHPSARKESVQAIYQAYLEKLKRGGRVQSTDVDVSTLTPYTDPIHQLLEVVYVNGLSVEWDERRPGQPRHVECDLGSEHPAYLLESSMMMDEKEPDDVAILRASPLRYQAYLHCLLEIDRQHASLVLEDADQKRKLNAIYEAAIQQLPCQAVYTWPKDLTQKAQQARLNVRTQAFPATLEKENKAFAQQHRALLDRLQTMASRSPAHRELQTFLNAQIQKCKAWESKLEDWPFYLPRSTWHADCLGAQLHACLLWERQKFLKDHPNLPTKLVQAVYQSYLEKIKTGLRVQSSDIGVKTLTLQTDPIDKTLEAVYINGLSVEWSDRLPEQLLEVECDLGLEHPAYLSPSELQIAEPLPYNAFLIRFSPMRYQARLHCLLAIDRQHACSVFQGDTEKCALKQTYAAAIQRLPLKAVYILPKMLEQRIQHAREQVRRQVYPATGLAQQHLDWLKGFQKVTNQPLPDALKTFLKTQIHTWETKLSAWPIGMPPRTLQLACLTAQLHAWLRLDCQTFLHDHPTVPKERVEAIYQSYLEKIKTNLTVKFNHVDANTLIACSDPIAKTLDGVYVNGLSVEWGDRLPEQLLDVECDLGSEHPTYLSPSRLLIAEKNADNVSLFRASPIRYQAYLHCLLETDRQYACSMLKTDAEKQALNQTYQAVIGQLPCQAVYLAPEMLTQRAQQVQNQLRQQAFPTTLEKENKRFAQAHLSLLTDLQKAAAQSPAHYELQSFLNAQIEKSKTWEAKRQTWRFYPLQSTWHSDCLGAQLYAFLLLDRQHFLQDHPKIPKKSVAKIYRAYLEKVKKSLMVQFTTVRTESLTAQTVSFAQNLESVYVDGLSLKWDKQPPGERLHVECELDSKHAAYLSQSSLLIAATNACSAARLRACPIRYQARLHCLLEIDRQHACSTLKTKAERCALNQIYAAAIQALPSHAVYALPEMLAQKAQDAREKIQTHALSCVSFAKRHLSAMEQLNHQLQSIFTHDYQEFAKFIYDQITIWRNHLNQWPFFMQKKQLYQAALIAQTQACLLFDRASILSGYPAGDSPSLISLLKKIHQPYLDRVNALQVEETDIRLHRLQPHAHTITRKVKMVYVNGLGLQFPAPASEAWQTVECTLLGTRNQVYVTDEALFIATLDSGDPLEEWKLRAASICYPAYIHAQLALSQQKADASVQIETDRPLIKAIYDQAIQALSSPSVYCLPSQIMKKAEKIVQETEDRLLVRQASMPTQLENLLSADLNAQPYQDRWHLAKILSQGLNAVLTGHPTLAALREGRWPKNTTKDFLAEMVRIRSSLTINLTSFMTQDLPLSSGTRQTHWSVDDEKRWIDFMKQSTTLLRGLSDPVVNPQPATHTELIDLLKAYIRRLAVHNACRVTVIELSGASPPQPQFIADWLDLIYSDEFFRISGMEGCLRAPDTEMTTAMRTQWKKMAQAAQTWFCSQQYTQNSLKFLQHLHAEAHPGKACADLKTLTHANTRPIELLLDPQYACPMKTMIRHNYNQQLSRSCKNCHDWKTYCLLPGMEAKTVAFLIDHPGEPLEPMQLRAWWKALAEAMTQEGLFSHYKNFYDACLKNLPETWYSPVEQHALCNQLLSRGQISECEFEAALKERLIEKMMDLDKILDSAEELYFFPAAIQKVSIHWKHMTLSLVRKLFLSIHEDKLKTQAFHRAYLESLHAVFGQQFGCPKAYPPGETICFNLDVSRDLMRRISQLRDKWEASTR